jgi:hypothetical protein
MCCALNHQGREDRQQQTISRRPLPLLLLLRVAVLRHFPPEGAVGLGLSQA